tara:strand:+ start:6512 stop:7261 length:750 start_codon:yes stop_codon:yes gene_type:complete
MAKDPAFLFYPKDFLTGITDLTMEERGQYITLLCLQHQKGAISEKLIQLTFNGNISNDVLNKFIKSDEGYFNERLKLEKEKRAKHSKRQSENAKKRWNKQKSMPSHKSGIQSGNAMAMPLVNVNVNEDVNIIEDVNKKVKKEIPKISEFLQYASIVFSKLDLLFDDKAKFEITSKYDAWKDNGWKNGFNKPIKIWKTTLRNTIPNLKCYTNKPQNNGNNYGNTKTGTTYSDSFKREILNDIQSAEAIEQ